MTDSVNPRTPPYTDHSSESTMSDRDSSRDEVEQRPGSVPWQHFIKKRWMLAATVAVIVGLSIWAFARRGGDLQEVSVAGEAISDDSSRAAAMDSVVRLDSVGHRLAGVELATIAPSTHGALMANGTITYDADRVSVISTRTEGRLIAVKADLGEQVRPGAVLALIESSDVGETRGDLQRARAAVEIARRNYEREQRLFAEQISPEKEMLEAEAAYRSAQAEYDAATAKLRAFGAASGEGATFGLVTPIGGTVVERSANPGQVVGPSSNLFTVADIGRVWITVDVYEGDLSRVQKGATAVVVPTALPNESFTGRVTFAGGVVDSLTHTFKVRVELANPEHQLRPGMFARVRIQAPAAGGAASTIVVPEVAVQQVGGKSVVFVAATQPGTYVVRPVTVGPRAGGGMVVIREGVRAGDRIVVKGAFQLKAELTKASFAEEE